MERQAGRKNGIIASLEQRDEAGWQRHAPLAREIGRMTGAAQQQLHFARPVFLLDLDQGLQFPPMMRIAQRVQNALQGVIRLPMLVHGTSV